MWEIGLYHYQPLEIHKGSQATGKKRENCRIQLGLPAVCACRTLVTGHRTGLPLSRVSTPNPYPTMPLSHLAPWQCPDAGTGFSGHQLRRIRVQLLLATWPLSSAACGRDQSLKKEMAKLKALVVNRDPRNTRSPHLDQFSPSWLTWFQNQNPRESYPWIQNSILGSGSGTACTSPGIFRSARTS